MDQTVARSEYLVRIEVLLPLDMATARRAHLLAAERTRGEELIELGQLRHIWRLPGRHANVSIYSTSGGTELHDLL